MRVESVLHLQGRSRRPRQGPNGQGTDQLSPKRPQATKGRNPGSTQEQSTEHVYNAAHHSALVPVLSASPRWPPDREVTQFCTLLHCSTHFLSPPGVSSSLQHQHQRGRTTTCIEGTDWEQGCKGPCKTRGTQSKAVETQS